MREQLARAAIAALAFFAFAALDWPELGAQARLVGAGAFAGWALGEGVLFWLRRRISHRVRVWVRMALDLVAISALVGATGFVQSPWRALFGLAVLSAAAEGVWQAPLALAWAAGLSWLALGFFTHTLPGPYSALLQVSAWLFAGATLAALTRRWQRSERAEAQMRDAHRALQRLHAHLFEVMREGVALLREDGRIVELNPAARRLLGGEPREVEARLRKTHGDVLAAAARGEMLEVEWEWDGRILLVRSAPLAAPVAGVAAVLTIADATPVRELERRLAEQARLAELGRMSAMVAHEVRNPLQTIRQAIAFLAEGDDPEVRAVMEEEVLRLERLVRSMLDFARPLAPRPRRVSAEDWLWPALRALPAHARARVHAEAGSSPVHADPDHLRVVLDNLLENALKREGAEVWLRWQVQDGRFRLEVEDTGGGVPEEMRGKIWDAFVSGTVGGVGLGLATVKRVCEANGWQVRLENTPKGARFVVEGDADGAGAAR